MRTRVFAVIALALATATGIVAERLYSEAHSDAGDEAVSALCDRALAHEKARGSLPREQSEVQTTIFGLLPGPRVRYRATEEDCTIAYEQWPLGPRWGRTCRSADWQGFSS